MAFPPVKQRRSGNWHSGHPKGSPRADCPPFSPRWVFWVSVFLALRVLLGETICRTMVIVERSARSTRRLLSPGYTIAAIKCQ